MADPPQRPRSSGPRAGTQGPTLGSKPPTPSSAGRRAVPPAVAPLPPLPEVPPLVPPVAVAPPEAAQESIRTRTSGLKLRPQPQDMKARLREGALDTVLNSAGILADVWDDFRRSDRYFKYKAAIIGGWLFLSISTFFVACPGPGAGGRNALDARLVLAGDASRPVYMIVNESDDPWKEVLVVANGKYRTAVGSVGGKGGTLTFIPKQLKGDNDVAAPPDLRILDLELRTDDGDVWLLKEGELQ